MCVHGKYLSKKCVCLYINVCLRNYSKNLLYIPQFDFMIITVIVIINKELRYYICVHSKMGVDNFVVLPK